MKNAILNGYSLMIYFVKNNISLSLFSINSFRIYSTTFVIQRLQSGQLDVGGRLMVRASDSGSGDPGSILGRVGVFVSLSKRHLLPKSTDNTQE